MLPSGKANVAQTYKPMTDSIENLNSIRLVYPRDQLLSLNTEKQMKLAEMLVPALQSALEGINWS